MEGEVTMSLRLASRRRRSVTISRCSIPSIPQRKRLAQGGKVVLALRIDAGPYHRLRLAVARQGRRSTLCRPDRVADAGNARLFEAGYDIADFAGVQIVSGLWFGREGPHLERGKPASAHRKLQRVAFFYTAGKHAQKHDNTLVVGVLEVKNQTLRRGGRNLVTKTVWLRRSRPEDLFGSRFRYARLWRGNTLNNRFQ